MTELEFLEDQTIQAYHTWTTLSDRLQAVCPHIKWLFVNELSQCERCQKVCHHESWHVESDDEHIPWCSLCGRNITDQVIEPS
jgi:hypothetical protein